MKYIHYYKYVLNLFNPLSSSYTIKGLVSADYNQWSMMKLQPMIKLQTMINDETATNDRWWK